jgi:hypothetical protein
LQKVCHLLHQINLILFLVLLVVFHSHQKLAFFLLIKKLFVQRGNNHL